MQVLRAVGKGILLLALLLVAAVVILAAYLSIAEYRPEPVEPLEAPAGGRVPAQGETLAILTCNTGYAALDATADFFMDGGRRVHPESEALVRENLEALCALLRDNPADAYFLQEVDVDSARSFGIDQAARYEAALGLESAFAYNYRCALVPYPLPMIGRVNSGLQTLTGLECREAARTQLPVPFSWPVRTANLKRCLLTLRVPLAGGGPELVLINLHLEAYDDGAGKRAQMEMLCGILEAERERGNYVIAGGDFNQSFPGALERFPIREAASWMPGILEADMLPEGFSWAYDAERPTCRLLDAPYDPAATQAYLLDGFLVSDNVRVDAVRTLETGFAHTDHQPVLLHVTLL